MRERIQQLLCLALCFLYACAVSAFQSSTWSRTCSVSKESLQATNQPAADTSVEFPRRAVIVVGKIIVDEYGPPDSREPPKLTVGGGGPQAAMGAALALAALDHADSQDEDDDE